jgi:hypothetical protein
MLSVATEIRQLVHDISSMEVIGVKIASAQDSALAQQAVAYTSSGLYSVITKYANDYSPQTITHHQQVVGFIDKVAQVLGLPQIPNSTRLKLAAAVVADDALSTVMAQTQGPELSKLAESQTFGREFVVELLREVL